MVALLELPFALPKKWLPAWAEAAREMQRMRSISPAPLLNEDVISLWPIYRYSSTYRMY